MRILLLVLLLAGCASKPPEVVVIGEPIYTSPVIFHPFLPDPLKLKPINVILLNSQVAERAFYESPSATYFSLTPAQYEILVLNLLHIEQYILELHSVIRQYRGAIDALDPK